MLKVALVGVGGISGAHIPVWDAMEDAELVALCDIRPERMERYADTKHCYTDFDEMLEKEQIDILDITLPTYMHVDFACKAMEKGINVLTEKPISLKVEDVARAYSTAERNNVKFMVAQVLRFWPEYSYIREVYQSGKYGKLLSGSMTRIGSAPKNSWNNWFLDEKLSGLVPFDLHIHDLDFLVYSFGDPKSCKSYRNRQKDQDFFNAIYDYGDFFITCQSGWYASPYPFTAEYRFQFEDAVISTEGGPLKVYERGGNILTLTGGDQDDKGDNLGYTVPQSNAYADEIHYFFDCVKNNKPVEKVQPHSLETVINTLHSL